MAQELELEKFYDGENWNQPLLVELQREKALANAEKLGHPIRAMDLLTDPLPLNFVENFERAFNVQLPTNYRNFLLQVGDGGIGPGLFMRPLGAPFHDSDPW